jgi:hypothetical protein
MLTEEEDLAPVGDSLEKVEKELDEVQRKVESRCFNPCVIKENNQILNNPINEKYIGNDLIFNLLRILIDDLQIFPENEREILRDEHEIGQNQPKSEIKNE